MSLPPRSSTTVLRMVGTLKTFAAFARPMTLFTIIIGSWLCRLANWKGWWSIRIRTDSAGVRRALRPFLGAMDWVMGVTPVCDFRCSRTGYRPFIAPLLAGNGFNFLQGLLESQAMETLANLESFVRSA